MELILSDEQRMLSESLDRLMREQYSLQQRSEYSREEDGWSPRVWSALSEMGLQSLPFAEEDGGIGGGAMENLIVMRSLGRALLLEPYWGSVILCGAILRHAASNQQRSRWFPGIMSGDDVYGLAHIESEERTIDVVSTTAVRCGEEWQLTGSKAMVLHGDSAQWFIVSARVSGAVNDRSGVALFAVPARSQGVCIKGYPTQDGRRAADVKLDSVRVGGDFLIGVAGEGWNVLENAFDIANAALCAEAAGVMEGVLKLTADFAATRSQFGVPLASFQAVQHHLADMLVGVEHSRSMALLAASACESEDKLERQRSVSAAKSFIAQAARRVGQKAVQLHGGVGMTEEYAVGHAFKRLTTFPMLLGDAAYHSARVASLGGLLHNMPT